SRLLVLCGAFHNISWHPLRYIPLLKHPSLATRSMQTAVVAVSLNSNDVQIFARQGNEWKPTETLSEHDKLITSIDWAPKSNRIVTSAQDRNAYVWQQTTDPLTGKLVWKPTLVINRAATYVRWSPNEDKFAVASGARAIAICSFDPEGDWWVSRLLKKPIRSTVLSIDWHPNNVLLAAGSADMKARVFSAYIKDVDKRPAPTVWGEKLPFNTICGEYTSPTGGWVHAVGFSPSGDVLAFASHDSSISIVYPGGPAVYTIKMSTLPLLTLAWTTEDSLVAAGHDCQPFVFSGDQSGWQLVGSLDDPSANKASGGGRSGFGGAPVGRLSSAAFNTFRNADSRGISNVPGSPTTASSTESELFTVHQNTITSVRAYEGAPGAVTKVSTSGVDGKLVVWDVQAVTPVGTGGLVGRMGGMHLR
ncbi:Actin-related protein 2/3 complex subunit 1, partial [Grifola frondosa]